MHCVQGWSAPLPPTTTCNVLPSVTGMSAVTCTPKPPALWLKLPRPPLPPVATTWMLCTLSGTLKVSAVPEYEYVHVLATDPSAPPHGGGGGVRVVIRREEHVGRRLLGRGLEPGVAQRGPTGIVRAGIELASNERQARRRVEDERVLVTDREIGERRKVEVGHRVVRDTDDRHDCAGDVLASGPVLQLEPKGAAPPGIDIEAGDVVPRRGERLPTGAARRHAGVHRRLLLIDGAVGGRWLLRTPERDAESSRQRHAEEQPRASSAFPSPLWSPSPAAPVPDRPPTLTVQSERRDVDSWAPFRRSNRSKTPGAAVIDPCDGEPIRQVWTGRLLKAPRNVESTGILTDRPVLSGVPGGRDERCLPGHRHGQTPGRVLPDGGATFGQK